MKVWLKNAKVASAIGFVILIALIWLLGGLIDVSRDVRFTAIMLVMLLWVATLLIGRAVANKAGGLLEGVLRKQADEAVINAGSGSRADVTMLRQRLLAAIDTLKTSKLGNARGRAALYELPWYMIIGHPAAGKSTAILHSGLTFPFSDKSGVQGVGGTRNCDWFFSTEGILLDTAGRYATHSEDRSEWLEFLKLLKEHRPRAPANGILIAVSLPELAQHQSEGFEVYARQVRERIHEIGNIFGMQVPVYLIFTKLDLLSGFSDFFQDASDEERAQVWGATLSANQGADFDLAAVVAQQFELLAKGLSQAGESKLALYRAGQPKSAFYAFPIEFHNLKEGAVKFVRLLGEHDPYHTRPLLRGFYFSSALQQGTPRIVAAGRVRTQFDLSSDSATPAPHDAASHSYFLRNLFREVIFPDQHLMSNQPHQRSRRWRIAGMAVGLLSLSVLVGAWTWSYIGNQQLLTQIHADRAQAEVLASSSELYDQLKGLALLQNRLQQLQTYRSQGAPWQINLGLYQGAAVEQALRREYFATLREVMLKPVQQNLELTLNALQPSAPAPRPAPVSLPAPIKVTPVKRALVIKPHRPHRSATPQDLPDIKLGAVSGERFIAVVVAYRPARDSGFRAMPVSDRLPANAQFTQAAQATPAVSSETPNASSEQNNARLDVGYNALKTYLMLHDPKHMETAQLTDQLPRYWRPYLTAHRGSYSDDEIMPLAGQLIAFYVSQVNAPDLPLIDNDAGLVTKVRERLRASFKQLSGPERVFNEIRTRANTRYAPLTVARILNNHDMDVVVGSQMVEGAFTRQAWGDYVSKLIDQASKGEIQGDDWVLASSIQEDLGQDGNVESNRAELMSLYRAQYINQWTKFVQGIAIQNFTSPAQAASALTRLDDPANSPVKLLLNRVAFETAWDNPSELSKSLDSAAKSLLQKTEALFNSNTPATGNNAATQYGVVGGVFAGVAQLVKGDHAPINGYLDQLAKVKSKFVAMSATDDPGLQAGAALKATLSGSGSEMADALAYVDNTMLSSLTPATRDMVRPLLVRPLMQSYSSLSGPMADDINRAWQAEVMPHWHELAAKYPFRNSNDIASIDEINQFTKADSGIFDAFVHKHLDGLVQKQGDSLVARSWGGMGLHLNPDFLNAAARLSAMSSAQMQIDGKSSFELQPLPTPGLADISFALDGQELHYRNGAQVWQPFNWPGTGPASARIQATTYSGAVVVVNSQMGRMGFLRLLSSATIEQSSSDSALLSWKIKNSAGVGTDTVRFNFRVVSGTNPLQIIRLQNLTLPERVTL